MNPPTWQDKADRALLACLFAIGVVLAFKTLIDPDLPGHLAYGMEHLRTGRLARTDSYSYTAAGGPWINHEWAFELLMAVAYSGLGIFGLLLLQAALLTATLALVLRLALRQTKNGRAAAVLFAGWIAVSFPWVAARPQLVSYLALALLLTVLDAGRRRPALLLLAAPLMAAWVNFHGGFLAGLGILSAYAVGTLLDRVRGTGDVRHARWAVASAALAWVATMVNPYGLELHRWLLWSLAEPNLVVTEWRWLGFSRLGFVFLLVVLVTIAAYRKHGFGSAPLAHLLPLAATLLFAVLQRRHTPFFAMMACAWAPAAAFFPKPTALTPGQYRAFRVATAGVFAYFVAIRLAIGPTLQLWHNRGGYEWPTGAIVYVDSLVTADHQPRNALITFNWAQLAIWRWHPHLRVHYDGRHRTVYPLEVEREHWAFIGQRNGDWRHALRNADLVLVEDHRPVADSLRGEPGWGLAYEDAVALVFLRGYTGPVSTGEPGPVAFSRRLSDPALAQRSP